MPIKASTHAFLCGALNCVGLDQGTAGYDSGVRWKRLIMLLEGAVSFQSPLHVFEGNRAGVTSVLPFILSFWWQ